MYFGSDLVYAYDSSSEEEIEDEELDQELHVSGGSDEEYEDVPSAKKLKSKWRVSRDQNLKGKTKRSSCSRMRSRSPPGQLPSPSGAVAPAAPLLTLASTATNAAEKFDVQHQSKAKRVRRADTNVLVVKFDTLSKPCAMHAGDATTCGGCGVVLTKISPITQRGEDKIWICEFCGIENVVDLEPEEIPQKPDVTFMLEPAPATSASGKSGTDDSLIVFCVDISGSMCVTTEVPGCVKLRGADHLDELQRFNQTREPQYLPGQRRDVTYVSRLQGVQAAVDNQLQAMHTEFPDRRPVIVAFNNEVTLFGDGVVDPVHISGDKLQKRDVLMELGASQPLPANIKQSRQRLSKKIYELEEGGGTSLGPALLVSLAVAAQRPGSKVILCTDGKANVGLGSLEKDKDETAMAEASAFYDEVSELALEKSVSVSVISIKGTDCKLVELGKVAAATGGQVNIVDPLKLTSEFSNILADSVIATNVIATLFLHKRLYFREESDRQSKVVRELGNVTAQTEVTFEYGMRRRENAVPQNQLGVLHEVPETRSQQQAVTTETNVAEKAEKSKEVENMDMETDTPMQAGASSLSDNATTAQKATTEATDTNPVLPTAAVRFDDLKELPFQLHICYTDVDGARAMRVITHTKPVTRDRQHAERRLNIDVLGMNMVQQTSAFAIDGRYSLARRNVMAQQRLMSAHSHVVTEDRSQYRGLFTKMKKLDSRLHKKQMFEKATTGTYSDDEEVDEETRPEGLCSFTEPVKGSAAAKPNGGTRGKGGLRGLFAKARPVKESKAAARHLACDDKTSNVMYKMVSKPSAWLKRESDSDSD